MNNHDGDAHHKQASDIIHDAYSGLGIPQARWPDTVAIGRIASALADATRRGFLVGTEAAAEYAEVSGEDTLASEIRTLHPGHYLKDGLSA